VGLIAPPTYIAPPGITGHRFGLFSVAAMPDDDARWQLGVEWEPLQGGPADLRAADCVDDYTGEVTPPATPDAIEGIPFVVVGGYICKATSRPVDEAEERARLALIGGEERATEQALMGAAVGNAPAFPDADVLTPGAVSLVEAFALLEEATGLAYHSSGVIHLPRSLAPHAHREVLIERYGQRLETIVGTSVAAGAGYDVDNVGPDGTPADEGQRWVYATGAVTIRRGPIFLQPDREHYLDKANNDLVILAQRDYLVTFSGPVFAALVEVAEAEG
jgi:hypothetical protein